MYYPTRLSDVRSKDQSAIWIILKSILLKQVKLSESSQGAVLIKVPLFRIILLTGFENRRIQIIRHIQRLPRATKH